MKFALLPLALLLSALPGTTFGHGSAKHAETTESRPATLPTADASAEDIVDAFGAALRTGDIGTMRQLLASDVLILEGGGAERSAEEYLGGHAISDAAFLKSAHIQRKSRTARTEGPLAWVATESEIHVQRDGKPVTIDSNETMILGRVEGRWTITLIHWSSARRAEKAAP